MSTEKKTSAEKKNTKNPPGNSPRTMRREKSNFRLDKKYLTISLYAIAVIAASALIIKAIFSWSQVAAVFKWIISMLLPFLAGGFIAYVINPLYNQIRRLLRSKCKLKSEKLQHVLSLISSYAIVTGAIVLLFSYIIPEIIENLVDIGKLAPELFNTVYEFLYTFEQRFPDLDMEYINNLIQNLEPTILSTIRDLATNVLPFIYTASISVVKFLFNAIIAIIVSVYILADKQHLLRMIRRIYYAWIPPKNASYYSTTIRECNRILNSFIIGKFIDSLIIGILCFILMNILKLDYALLISVIVGVTNMIPYFGPWIGAVPGTALLLFIDPLQALIFVILIIVLQQFDGLILGPKILGDSTGLKPLWIIFAITVGGSLAGVAGMFFGVPVVAVLSFLFNRYIDHRLIDRSIDL